MNNRALLIALPILALAGAFAGSLFAADSWIVASIIIIAAAAPAVIVSVLELIERPSGESRVSIVADRKGFAMITIGGKHIVHASRAELILEPDQKPVLNLTLLVDHVDARLTAAQSFASTGGQQQAREYIESVRLALKRIEDDIEAAEIAESN